VLAALVEAFEQAYEKMYGLRIAGSEVEVVTWSVTVSTQAQATEQADLLPATRERQPSVSTEVWEPGCGERRAFGHHWRFDIAPGEYVVGPALVAEHETTVVVPAGWCARLDSHGNLVMEAQS
jgi:N-methylhydantoinase A